MASCCRTSAASVRVRGAVICALSLACALLQPAETADPTCATGVKSGTSCCLKSCGACGGSGCSGRPGGAACCSQAASKGAQSCHSGNPPCYISPPPPPPGHTASCSDVCPASVSKISGCPCRSVASKPPYAFPAATAKFEADRDAALEQAERAGTAWVALDKGGRLVYGKTADGSHVPDFSNVGYHGGDLPLPGRSAIPTLATLTADPGGGDDTARIQAALDAAGQSSVSSATGYRGAVLLGAGTFRINATLYLRQSGVVLRGNGRDSTTLLGTTAAQYTMVSVLGTSCPGVAPHASMTDGRVTADAPVGTRALKVANTTGFAAGDVVFLAVPVTDPTLIETLRMDRICFPGKFTRGAQNWTFENATSVNQWESGYRRCSSCSLATAPSTAGKLVRGSVVYERTVASVDTATQTLTFVEPVVQVIKAKCASAPARS